VAGFVVFGRGSKSTKMTTYIISIVFPVIRNLNKKKKTQPTGGPCMPIGRNLLECHMAFYSGGVNIPECLAKCSGWRA